MSSTVTLDPASIRAYGTASQEIFSRIRSDLEALVQDVVAVDYQGENAVKFKTDCGRIAADFGTAIAADLRAIADAVRTSTTNLAQALGGGPVSIDVNGGAVSVPPVPASDGRYSADPSGLEGLKGTVSQRFGAIQEQFDTHLTRLQATSWTGRAKDQAVQQVGTFTTKARSKIGEASASVNGFIDKQLEALRLADQ